MAPAVAGPNDRTRAPDRTSGVFSPAAPPPRGDASVPTRSRISRNSRTEPSSSSARKRLRRQPGPPCDDHRLDARLQGRIDHRREPRIVVGRDLAEAVRGAGLRVEDGIDAAYEPE